MIRTKGSMVFFYQYSLITQGYVSMSIKLTTTSKVDQQAERQLQHLPQDTEQKTARGKRLKLILRTGISITLICLLLKAVSWPTLLTTLAHSRQADILMGLAVGILCIYLS